MKNILLSVCCLLASFSLSAQLDDRPYPFTRNVVTIGLGNHASGPRTIYNTNVEIEYERFENHLFSISALYKYMEREYFSRSFSGKEVQLNAHYYPFTNLRMGVLKLGAGVNFSANSGENFAEISEDLIRVFNRQSTTDWGLNGLAEYRLNITKHWNIGVRAYSQLNTYEGLEFGWIVKSGFAF